MCAFHPDSLELEQRPGAEERPFWEMVCGSPSFALQEVFREGWPVLLPHFSNSLHFAQDIPLHLANRYKHSCGIHLLEPRPAYIKFTIKSAPFALAIRTAQPCSPSCLLAFPRFLSNIHSIPDNCGHHNEIYWSRDDRNARLDPDNRRNLSKIRP